MHQIVQKLEVLTGETAGDDEEQKRNGGRLSEKVAPRNSKQVSEAG